ncbi:MAG: ABC transporter permease subunit [Ilumatobacter sp.]
MSDTHTTPADSAALGPTGPVGPGEETLPGAYSARAIAYLIDVGLIALVLIAAFVVALIGGLIADAIGGVLFALGALAALAFAIWNLYVRQGQTGQSIGKAAMGVYLVDAASGKPVGGAKAFVRYLVGGLLSSLTLGVYGVLDVLSPLADKENKRLTDKIVKMKVVEPTVLVGKVQIRREQLRVLYTSPGFIVGVLIVGFWVLASVFPGVLTSFGPKEFVEAGPRVSPSTQAWLGTDKNGWDVYTRIIYGARQILTIAPIATALAIAVGTFLGLIMGYYKGWVDEILSRVIEAILSIPIILMAILIVFTFGRSTPVIIGTIAVLFVPAITRTIRSAAIAESDLDYVMSAKMRGESGFFIVGREILPNVIGLVVVELTVRLGYAIFTYTTLAFLGFVGGNITDADWGIDVSQNYEQIARDIWWPSIFPAAAIASLVIGVNLIADSIDKATKS